MDRNGAKQSSLERRRRSPATEVDGLAPVLRSAGAISKHSPKPSTDLQAT